jgi:hypothetical protein
MTVGEFLARVSSEELTQWIALLLLEAQEQRDAEIERKTLSGHQSVMSRPRPRLG